jgi:hypothetical protein
MASFLVILLIPAVIFGFIFSNDNDTVKDKLFDFIIFVAKFVFFFELPVLSYLVLQFTQTSISKNDCPNGWIDCYFNASGIQAPLYLWFVISIFYNEESRADLNKSQSWVIGGIIVGNVFNLTMLSYLFGSPLETGFLFFSVIQVYLIFKLIKAIQIYKPSILIYPIMLCISSLFTYINVLLAKAKYESLPDSLPSDCFIVTAASNGHSRIVKSFTCSATGHITNTQLITFKRFEYFWKDTFPRSYSTFRIVYNYIGPKIASCIKSKILADIMYIILKPIEIICQIIICFRRGAN